VQRGKTAPPGEKKLHLLIEGKDEADVLAFRAEVVRILEETAERSQPQQRFGKYSVI
jgi:hypothetical protein